MTPSERNEIKGKFLLRGFGYGFWLWTACICLPTLTFMRYIPEDGFVLLLDAWRATLLITVGWTIIVIYAKRRITARGTEFQALSDEQVQQWYDKVVAAAKEQSRKRRFAVLTALTILLVLGMFLIATNPRVDAFRSYADSKGYVFPGIGEKNFVCSVSIG